MVARLVVLVGALTALVGSAAAAPAPLSHEPFVRDVKAAEEKAFAKALATFDAHLARSPDDAAAAVERCKFITGTMRGDEDRDEGDEERGNLHEDCLASLEERFPRSPVALSYRLSVKWGDDAIDFAKRLLADPKLTWSARDLAGVYEKLARLHTFKKQPLVASDYAERAVALDRSLDLGEIIGGELVTEGRTSEAIVALSAHAENDGYVLMQKAKLLTDAGAPTRALWMLRLAEKQHAYIDPSTYASILEHTGDLAGARQKYGEVKALRTRHTALTHLFTLALAGNDAGAAVESFQALRALGWRGDPLAGYQLALWRKFPAAGWKARDWGGLIRLFFALLFCALVPGLWVIPIHYWSLARRLRGPLVVEPTLATRWRFLHVWLGGAAFLTVQFLLLDITSYAEVASWFQTPVDKSVTTPAAAMATYGLWESALLTITLGLLFVRRGELRLFGPGAWTVARCLGRAAAAMGILVGLLLVVGLVVRMVGAMRGVAPAAVGIEELIRSVHQVYGIGGVIVVAVIVAPITEELVFRSIMLDVFARFMPFLAANFLQAILFASAHAELSRLPYLFAVGFLCGWLRRRSGGLLAPILLHMMNNTIAAFLTLAVATPTVKPTTHPQPFSPSPELMSCVRSARNLKGLAPESLRGVSGAMAAEMLNRVAWEMAIDETTSPACLRRAEEAVNGSLRQFPEMPSVLDTKATVYYREGRVDEAIDLERLAMDRADHRAFYSQLDRFLRAHDGPLLVGPAWRTPPKMTFEPRPSTQPSIIHVELGDDFKEGVWLYAHVTDSHGTVGLFRAVFGPDHLRSYRLEAPAGSLLEDARFEVALVDSRGCERCSRDHWSWEMQPHDPDADKYAPLTSTPR